jgi:hypothetical protein
MTTTFSTTCATPAEIVAFFKDQKNIVKDEDGDAILNDSMRVQFVDGRRVWIRVFRYFVELYYVDNTKCFLAFCQKSNSCPAFCAITAHVVISGNLFSIEFDYRSNKTGEKMGGGVYEYTRKDRKETLKKALQEYLATASPLSTAVPDECEVFAKMIVQMLSSDQERQRGIFSEDNKK